MITREQAIENLNRRQQARNVYTNIGEREVKREMKRLTTPATTHDFYKVGGPRMSKVLCTHCDAPIGTTTPCQKQPTAQHTPGPREQLEGWTTRCGCHVNTMSELEYCPTHAAAPKLLAALEYVQERLNALGGPTVHELAESAAHIDVAIRKATGEAK